MQNGRNTSAELKPQYSDRWLAHILNTSKEQASTYATETQLFGVVQCKMRNKLGKYQLKLSSPQQELFASVFCGIPLHSTRLESSSSTWEHAHRPSEDESLPWYFMYLRRTNGQGMRNDDGEWRGKCKNWNLHCPPEMNGRPYYEAQEWEDTFCPNTGLITRIKNVTNGNESRTKLDCPGGGMRDAAQEATGVIALAGWTSSKRHVVVVESVNRVEMDH